MSAQSEGVGGISIPVRGEPSSVRELIVVKARFLVPMIAIYMVSYIGLTALAGFAKGLIALKVAGSLNLGFVLIAFNYLLAWALALVYVRIANTIFDPLVERVVAMRARKRRAA